MTASARPNEELVGLVSTLIDGKLSAAEQEHLTRLLAHDTAARASYYAQVRMHAQLVWNSHRPQAMPWPGDAEPAAIPSLPPAPAFLVDTIPATTAYFSSGWPVAYLIATVIFGIGAPVGSLITVSRYVPSKPVAQHSAPSPQPLIPSAPTVGQITGMVDCQFNRPKGQDFSPKTLVSLGDTFALASGLLEITYDTGARVILQGPVTYEVESPASGYLSLGKLTADVEKAKAENRSTKSETISKSPSLQISKLFVVRTPTATVTDLGTEFGVEVSQEGQTTSHVFRGSVEVQPVGRDGRRGQAVRLTENESVQVENDAGGGPLMVRRVAADSAAFVRVEQLPKLVEDLRLKAFRRWQVYSRELRRDPPLLVYYDFQLGEGKPAVLRNVAANGDRSLDGVVENATWSDGRMPGKHALLFNGPADYVQIDLPQKTDDLTLAAWVNVESIDNDYSGLLMSKGWNDGQRRVHWQVRPDGRVGFGVWNTCNLWQSAPAFDRARFHRWTHLAAVYDHVAACVRFYLNGQMTDETWIQKHVPICIGPAQIGLASMWTPPRSFHGRIDEMAIFGRPLKSHEIQRMFEAGKPAGVGDISVHSDNK